MLGGVVLVCLLVCNMFFLGCYFLVVDDVLMICLVGVVICVVGVVDDLFDFFVLVKVVGQVLVVGIVVMGGV